MDFPCSIGIEGDSEGRATPLTNRHDNRSFLAMVLATALSNTQVYVALVIALIPAVLAFRLSTELYK
mgnify:CR=1 FL=1